MTGLSVGKPSTNYTKPNRGRALDHMRDVVSPYVICTILTVGNTGGANTDPRYAGGATRVRNRLMVKNSYARRLMPTND